MLSTNPVHILHSGRYKELRKCSVRECADRGPGGDARARIKEYARYVTASCIPLGQAQG